MADVTIYTKVGCPYCAAAKKHYGEQGITFDEIDIHNIPSAQDDLLNLTRGERIVPVIIDNGELKTGFGGG